jgi:hypothetical protein
MKCALHLGPISTSEKVTKPSAGHYRVGVTDVLATSSVICPSTPSSIPLVFPLTLPEWRCCDDRSWRAALEPSSGLGGRQEEAPLEISVEYGVPVLASYVDSRLGVVDPRAVHEMSTPPLISWSRTT